MFDAHARMRDGGSLLGLDRFSLATPEQRELGLTGHRFSSGW
jgi:hypothetical protein